MNAFTNVSIKEFSINPFISIGKEWMLISSAKADGSTNTMTAAWGGLGWLWERPVAFIFVRQTRYTKEFIDESGKVSLSFLGMGFRKQLAYLGSASGRDEDKIAKSGLNIVDKDGIPFVEEARLAIFGHVIASELIPMESFMDDTIAKNHYADKNLHTMYVVQIDEILEKEQ